MQMTFMKSMIVKNSPSKITHQTQERLRTLSANTTFGMMAALGIPPRPERVKKAHLFLPMGIDDDFLVGF